LALRLSAAALEHELANSVQLELIERAVPQQTDQPPPASDDCPSADDLLDFCHGSLPAPGAIGVQRHLDVCPACMAIATLALNDWGACEPAEWLDVASNFQPGDRIDDRYQIVRFLASGGMGEVYEAIDRRSSERVALKAVLAAACDSREMLRCFRREARLARRVRHPNVCQVHRAPASADVITRPLVPYFTMDLIEGETLRERLQGGPLPLGDALDIARQLLLGIQAIHRANVLHLDIKSNNIMLRRGPALHAVLFDFGLARRATSASNDERTRPLRGSLSYIPPEQLVGVSPSVQNDIFAFGVVLFQMLTGELPFSNARGTPASNVAERLTAKAPPPSQIISALPTPIDDLVQRCLARREERFATVEAVMAATARASQALELL
jgi:serine/threonine protein kinase